MTIKTGSLVVRNHEWFQVDDIINVTSENGNDHRYVATKLDLKTGTKCIGVRTIFASECRPAEDYVRDLLVYLQQRLLMKFSR